MNNVPTDIAMLLVDLVMPPEEVSTIDKYQLYIKRKIELVLGTPAPPQKARSRSPIGRYLESIQDNPTQHIIGYDPDVHGVLAMHLDQGNLDKDEVRLANGSVLVFPEAASDNPSSFLTIRGV